jgi:hypothetical protein
MGRLARGPRVGPSPGSGYPWTDGDVLYAQDLNDAIAGANGPAYMLPVATPTTLGGVKPDGTSILVTADGLISSTGGGGGGGGGLSEAPVDGHAYGRQSAAWKQVIAATNDIVDGGNF